MEKESKYRSRKWALTLLSYAALCLAVATDKINGGEFMTGMVTLMTMYPLGNLGEDYISSKRGSS
tara:strand:- start:513 stop:707 length:195 start_codon:yes stop_codon:yes gene_type:complete